MSRMSQSTLKSGEPLLLRFNEAIKQSRNVKSEKIKIQVIFLVLLDFVVFPAIK